MRSTTVNTFNFSTATVVGSLSNGVSVEVRGRSGPREHYDSTRVTVEDPTVVGPQAPQLSRTPTVIQATQVELADPDRDDDL